MNLKKIFASLGCLLEKQEPQAHFTSRAACDEWGDDPGSHFGGHFYAVIPDTHPQTVTGGIFFDSDGNVLGLSGNAVFSDIKQVQSQFSGKLR
jgi:hypothetical protein